MVPLLCTFVPIRANACTPSQDSTKVLAPSGDPLKVYVDCDHCDMGYIKDNIRFVDYVRDMTEADIHLMIRRVGTGSGGHKYTLTYLVRDGFAGRNDVLTYVSNSTDTRDAERQGLVQTIKLGLMPYVIKSSLAKYFSISYNGTSERELPGDEKDPWNSWVFQIDIGADIHGEESKKEYSLNGSLSAERVTDAWKINFDFDENYDYDRYYFSDGTHEITRQHDEDYDGLVAKSLSPRGSLGLFSTAGASTYDNIQFSAGIGPAIEFDIFPYSEYTHHEFSFQYHITPHYSNYIYETVFLKYEQLLIKHGISINYNLIEPWGEIDCDVDGSSLFNNLTKNRLDLEASLDIQIYRGLSVHFWGKYSLINNQLSLPKGNSTNEEILLNLRQQATSHSYRASVGLRYTFGSIYNNTVNTRF